MAFTMWSLLVAWLLRLTRRKISDAGEAARGCRLNVEVIQSLKRGATTGSLRRAWCWQRTTGLLSMSVQLLLARFESVTLLGRITVAVSEIVPRADPLIVPLAL